MAERVAIFIDGAYLDYVFKDEFRGAKVNYEVLAQMIAGQSELLRTYYYHCPPYQGRPPTYEEQERYSSQRRFFTALERIPRFTVRLGRLAYRGKDRDGKPRYEQKRVDILLGVDLTLLAVKGRIQEAILVAGDSDFIPAVEVAKQEGVLVRLVHGDSPHSDLWETVDERQKITQSMIDKVTITPRLALDDSGTQDIEGP